MLESENEDRTLKNRLLEKNLDNKTFTPFHKLTHNTFASLKVGDVFRFYKFRDNDGNKKYDFYMKIEQTQDDDFNAVSLNTGNVYHFEFNEEINKAEKFEIIAKFQR